MKLLFSPTFLRNSKRLFKRNLKLAEKVSTTLSLLEVDINNPTLKTHKLQGKYEGLWACSVEYDMRIVFKVVQNDGEDALLLLKIGKHDDVYY